MNRKQKPTATPIVTQILINFVIPVIILTRFSAESSLGPVKSMLLALGFPVAYEVYNIAKRKKPSLLSALAIGGIVVTGAISLLGLSEGWLAARRSIPYFAISLAILVSVLVNRSFIEKFLPTILEMHKVESAIKEHNSLLKLKQCLKATAYQLSGLYSIIGVVSIFLTRSVITSATNSAAFNAEYGRLRILSLPFITLPIIVGSILVVVRLFSRIEKLSGLELESIIKKKQ